MRSHRTFASFDGLNIGFNMGVFGVGANANVNISSSGDVSESAGLGVQSIVNGAHVSTGISVDSLGHVDFSVGAHLSMYEAKPREISKATQPSASPRKDKEKVILPPDNEYFKTELLNWEKSSENFELDDTIQLILAHLIYERMPDQLDPEFRGNDVVEREDYTWLTLAKNRSGSNKISSILYAFENGFHEGLLGKWKNHQPVSSSKGTTAASVVRWTKALAIVKSGNFGNAKFIDSLGHNTDAYAQIIYDTALKATASFFSGLSTVTLSPSYIMGAHASWRVIQYQDANNVPPSMRIAK